VSRIPRILAPSVTGSVPVPPVAPPPSVALDRQLLQISPQAHASGCECRCPLVDGAVQFSSAPLRFILRLPSPSPSSCPAPRSSIPSTHHSPSHHPLFPLPRNIVQQLTAHRRPVRHNRRHLLHAAPVIIIRCHVSALPQQQKPPSNTSVYRPFLQEAMLASPMQLQQHAATQLHSLILLQ
jgi:hypothetical protein